MQFRSIALPIVLTFLASPAWSENPSARSVQVTFNINLLHIPALCLIKMLKDDAAAYRECRKISARSELRMEAGDFGSLGTKVEVTDEELKDRITEELENLGPLLRSAAFGQTSGSPITPQTVGSIRGIASQTSDGVRKTAAKTTPPIARTQPTPQLGGATPKPATGNTQVSPAKDRKRPPAAQSTRVNDLDEILEPTEEKPNATVSRATGQRSDPLRRGIMTKATQGENPADF